MFIKIQGCYVSLRHIAHITRHEVNLVQTKDLSEWTTYSSAQPTSPLSIFFYFSGERYHEFTYDTTEERDLAYEKLEETIKIFIDVDAAIL